MAPSQFARLKVADLMAAPVALPATTSVREAAIFLARGGTAFVPVVSPDGTFTGVFGEADIHRRLSEVTHGFHSPGEFRTGVPFLGGPLPDSLWDRFARVGFLSVADLRREVAPIGQADALPKAFDAMRRQGVSALPVLDDGELVGVLHTDAFTLRLMDFAVRRTEPVRGGRADVRATVFPAPRRPRVPEGP